MISFTSGGVLPRYTKAAVFVDGSFLEMLIRERFPGKQLSIRPFLSQILDPFNNMRSLDFMRLIRTYYYDAVPEDLSRVDSNLRERIQKKIEFLDYLEEFCNNVDVRRGFLRIGHDPDGPMKQKGVEVSMGSDMAIIAWMGKVDEIVIVGADGDLVPAVDVAKRAMITVHLISDARKLNPNLKKAVDTYYLNLADFVEERTLLYDPSAFTDPGALPVELSRLYHH